MEATRSAAAAQAQTTIIPASSWSERRLLFRIRKRGFLVCGRSTTNLLISNPLGVWSLRHRRYVRRTRYHRFCDLEDDAAPVQRRYAALRGLGMLSWPEYDERVALWRRRLVDMYWDAAPPERREAVVRHFRAVRRERRLSRLVVYPLLAALVAAVCCLAVLVAQSQARPVWFRALVPLVCLGIVYVPSVNFVRVELLHENDAIVELLEKFERLAHADD